MRPATSIARSDRSPSTALRTALTVGTAMLLILVLLPAVLAAQAASI